MLDGRVAAEPLGEDARARGLPCERAPPASRARGAGARRRPAPRSTPVRERNSSTRAAVVSCSRRRARRRARRRGPARYFVAEWSATSQPSSSGRTCERRRGRRVADDERRVRGCGLEVRHRQERVRGRLEPDEVGVRPAAARSGRTRRAGGPSARARGAGSRAVVRALGERDGLAGLEQREDHRGRRRRAGREEQRLARRRARRARRSASATVGLDEARVRELARLAVDVRPRDVRSGSSGDASRAGDASAPRRYSARRLLRTAG